MILFEPVHLEWDRTGRTADLDPFIAAALADAGGDALYVEVPAHPDRSLFVVSSLAHQCGPDAERCLGQALDGSGALRDWLHALDPFVADRPVIVHMLGSTRKDIASALGDATGLRWLAQRSRQRRVVFTPWRGPTSRRDAQPARSDLWDSADVWRRVGADVDRYALAAAYATFVGTLPARAVASDTSRLAAALWAELPGRQQDFLGLLLTHDRALFEEHALALGLATKDDIEAAVRSHLVERRAGQLVLARGVRLSKGLQPNALTTQQHLRLAQAFEGALEHPGSAVDRVTATIEAHRHYASILRIDEAFRLARYGFGVLLEMAVEQSRAGSFLDAVKTYEGIEALADAARLPVDQKRRVRAYAVHYRHYNQYRARISALGETIAGYAQSIELWPENALFASRHVRALFYDRREEEALTAFARAWAHAIERVESARYLVDRSILRLLDHGEVVPALALASKAPEKADAAVWRRLEAALATGAWTSRLWAPGLPGVDAPEPVRLRVIREDSVWRALGPSSTWEEEQPLSAVTSFMRDQVFRALAARWVKATAHGSSRARAFAHPDYQSILRMGSAVVPEILRWIRSGRGGHWDQALTTLTGRPAPTLPEPVTLSKVMSAWVHWGEDTGLLERA